MICAPPCSELPSFQLEWRTHCYIHPRSLLARWSSGTANSGDFRDDSRLAQNFFRRGFLPFSVWRSLYLSRSLRGLEFRGTHHGRVGSWVGESLWCWSSLLLIGWLWAQLSSGSTHSTKHTYVYVRVCACACACARTSRYWVVSLRPSILSCGTLVCPRILHLHFG